MSMIDRRQFAARAAAAALGATGLPSLSPAAGVASRPYTAEMPDMLLAHLARKLSALATKWDAERAKIQTADQVEARNRFVREKFREMVHGFPERNPLNAVVVKSTEKDGYRVENVMFESKPDFWVTGNLYIPTTGKGPFPGIISPCGHYPLARMQPDYQFVYLNLVTAGFVVLGYDPIGQGERRQYWDPSTGKADIADPVFEHSMPGQILLLMGEDLTHYRIWDGMRAIDYLLTRPEVDKQKIGCAGHSGGGTLSLFISALDERVKCAVVNEGGTRHRWPVWSRPGSNVGPSDVEQNLFPAAVYGADLCDLHVAIAPRPLLSLTEHFGGDYNVTAEHIKNRYRQMGVPEKFATVEAGDPHAYTLKLRQATTDWFSRWFYDRKGPETEPEFEAAPKEQLYCTPNGSIRYSEKGDTIFARIHKKAATLPPQRTTPLSAAEIRKALRYRKSNESLAPRHIATTQRKGYRIEKLEFLSEPGICIPTWVFLPAKPGPSKEAVLLVNEAGKEVDGMEFGLAEGLARKGRYVVAVDVRGVGDTTPPHGQELLEPYEFRQLFDPETAMSYMCWFMDESLFGMRVADVVRSVDYTLSRSEIDKTGLQLIGKGAGALWALYAAVLDPRIRKVYCENGLASYRALAEGDRYLYGANVMLRDVLLSFDLPQVAAAVQQRPVTLLSPLDRMKAAVTLEAAKKTYEGSGARILERREDADPAAQYLELLG